MIPESYSKIYRDKKKSPRPGRDVADRIFDSDMPHCFDAIAAGLLDHVKDTNLLNHRRDGLPIWYITRTNAVTEEAKKIFSNNLFHYVKALSATGNQEEAEKIYHQIEFSDISVLIKHREDGLPMNSIYWTDLDQTLFGTNIFSYINALCSLGRHSKARKIYETSLKSRLFDVHDASMPRRYFMDNYYGKGKHRTSSRIASDCVFEYISAMCSMGDHDKARGLLNNLDKTPLLTHRIDGLPIWEINNDMSAGNTALQSTGAFTYINALCSLGLPGPALSAYNRLSETRILKARHDGLPIWSIDNGVTGFEYNDIHASAVFSCIEALMSLHRHFPYDRNANRGESK